MEKRALEAALTALFNGHSNVLDDCDGALQLPVKSVGDRDGDKSMRNDTGKASESVILFVI